MRAEVEKETPKKDTKNERIFMTSHKALSAVPFLTYIFRTKIS